MENTLTWLLGGIALVNFLGAAVVYLRGSRDKGTIETLKRSNDALQENNQILNDRVVLLEASDKANTSKIEGQAHTIEVLTNTVNSADLIRDLKSEVLTSLNAHHDAAVAGIAQIHRDLGTLPDRIATALGGNA